MAIYHKQLTCGGREKNATNKSWIETCPQMLEPKVENLNSTLFSLINMGQNQMGHYMEQATDLFLPLHLKKGTEGKLFGGQICLSLFFNFLDSI